MLVSELMLQQTQVSRVEPRWHAFLARWPSATACAADPAAEVVREWAGLGYNRRALNLHRCASALVAHHRGEVPDDLGALLDLPGIGPYTARAVLAFAFGRDVGILDVNASRVIARAVAGRPVKRRAAQALADELVPEGCGWEWNQAVLDLGATVCTARRPACGRCPLAHGCAWFGSGGPDPAAVGTGRQSRFAGSDREGRGRLLDALRRGPVADRGAACGWPADPLRAERVAAQLVAEGFAVERGDVLELRER